MGSQEEEFNQISNMITVSTAILSSSGLRFITANEISPVSGSGRSKRGNATILSIRKAVISTLDWKKSTECYRFYNITLLQSGHSTESTMVSQNKISPG